MFKPNTFIKHKETGTIVKVQEDKEYSSELYKKWKPKVDEYCWFYDEDCELGYAYLSKFKEMEDGAYVDSSCTVFDCCEPFIGIRPIPLQ